MATSDKPIQFYLRPGYKEVRWRFPANENSHGLFCRQMCMYAFIGQYNEQIASLPDLVQV